MGAQWSGLALRPCATLIYFSTGESLDCKDSQIAKIKNEEEDDTAVASSANLNLGHMTCAHYICLELTVPDGCVLS